MNLMSLMITLSSIANAPCNSSPRKIYVSLSTVFLFNVLALARESHCILLFTLSRAIQMGTLFKRKAILSFLVESKGAYTFRHHHALQIRSFTGTTRISISYNPEFSSNPR